MIYLFDDFDGLTTQEVNDMLRLVPPDRRDKALAYHRDIDRRQSLIAYHLLDQGLQREYHLTDAPVLVTDTPGGKPVLQGHPDIHFNLSHCPHAVACAISEQPVGIDVEAHDNYDPALVPVVLNDWEQHCVNQSSRPDIAFTRYWTMKEGLLKLHGAMLEEKLLPNLLNNASHYDFVVMTMTDYTIAVCQFKSASWFDNKKFAQTE